MSLSKIILVLSLLIFALPECQAAASAKPAAKDAKSSDSGEKKEKGEGKSKSKMSLEGGLYTTDKVSVVKNNKGNRPVSIRTE